MPALRRLASVLSFLAVLGADPLAGQVSVAPTILFTSEREPFATFAVSNGSATPQEVEIEFRFGYPRTDSTGAMVMEYADTAAAARYGVDRWVQAFPRRFVLGAGEQQVVRMAVRPPAGLPAGAYWTRVVTTSTPREAAVDTAASGGVATRIVMRLQHVTTLLHRNGQSSSGVEVGEIAAAVDDGGRQRLSIPLRRTGNHPFLGTLFAELRDDRGALVAEIARPVAVYFDVIEQMTLDEVSLPPGRYRVTLTVRAGRPDVSPEHTIPLDPVVRQGIVEWP